MFVLYRCVQFRSLRITLSHETLFAIICLSNALAITHLSVVIFRPPFTVSWVIEWIPKQGIGRKVLVQLAV